MDDPSDEQVALACERTALGIALTVHAVESISEAFENLPQAEGFEIVPGEEVRDLSASADSFLFPYFRHTGTGEVYRLRVKISFTEMEWPEPPPGDQVLF